jgi:2-polyprenyl-3-methyl-5-hydroxy-6-metoxy-1,4-benzoquinol methylase
MFHPTNVGEDGAYVTVNPRPHGGHAKLLSQVDGGGRVLDVGCSTGYLSKLLVERGSTVVGIELDEEAAAQAERWCETVLTGDVERMELPFEPASFDAVMCADLIEHLREPGAFLARVRPLLRPGGRLALTTPNVANWTIRLALLLGRFDYTERGILDRTHTHLFTRRSLTRCLEDAGYRLESLDFTVPVPGIGTPRVEALAHAIGRLRPSLFAFQFVVAASPR